MIWAYKLSFHFEIFWNIIILKAIVSRFYADLEKSILIYVPSKVKKQSSIFDKFRYTLYSEIFRDIIIHEAIIFIL